MGSLIRVDGDNQIWEIVPKSTTITTVSESKTWWAKWLPAKFGLMGKGLAMTKDVPRFVISIAILRLYRSNAAAAQWRRCPLTMRPAPTSFINVARVNFRKGRRGLLTQSYSRGPSEVSQALRCVSDDSP